ncbi:MAG: hypothetical protein Q9164_007514, partial [Protoblastenia rupestris]
TFGSENTDGNEDALLKKLKGTTSPSTGSAPAVFIDPYPPFTQHIFHSSKVGDSRGNPLIAEDDSELTENSGSSRIATSMKSFDTILPQGFPRGKRPKKQHCSSIPGAVKPTAAPLKRLTQNQSG